MLRKRREKNGSFCEFPGEEMELPEVGVYGEGNKAIVRKGRVLTRSNNVKVTYLRWNPLRLDRGKERSERGSGRQEKERAFEKVQIQIPNN